MRSRIEASSLGICIYVRIVSMSWLYIWAEAGIDERINECVSEVRVVDICVLVFVCEESF